MLTQLRSRLILLIIVFIVASAAFSGYFSKFAFNDIQKPYGDFSLVSMLNGETQKPYVYRQLLPYTSNFVVTNLPSDIKENIKTWFLKDRYGENNNIIHRIYAQAEDSNNPDTIIAYYIVYLLSFASLFFAILIFREINIQVGLDNLSSTLAPLLFVLIIPYLQTEASFFYDLSELLFMGLAILLSIKKRYLLLIAITLLATLNKESFLAFSIALSPFLITNLGMKKGLALQAILVGLCAAINYFIKARYANNLGGMVELHLVDQFQALLTIRTYFQYDFIYGVIAPRGYNILTILLIYLVVKSSYSSLPHIYKCHTLLALAINIPLFIVFCFPGELRNLSFMFVSFNIMLAICIRQLVIRNATIVSAT